MKRRDVMGLVGVAAILAGCGNTYTWNQKLTVTVDTPDGPKSGSSVVQVSATVGKPNILSQAVVSYKVSGEATVVDLGNGKYLFALLSSGGEFMPTEYWAAHCFQAQLVKEFSYGSEEKLSALFTKFKTFRGSCQMVGERQPLLVTFRDISDPKSVVQVKPDKLAEVFGQGFALKSISLEITEEAVGKGSIEKLLVWIPSYFDGHLDGNRIETIKATNRLANSLASGNFTTWRQ